VQNAGVLHENGQNKGSERPEMVAIYLLFDPFFSLERVKNPSAFVK